MAALRQVARSPRALGLLAGLCLLAAILALVVGLAGGRSRAVGGGAALPPTVARKTPFQSIFQADIQLLSDPIGTLRLLRGLGVSRVRLFVPWGPFPGRPSIAPDPLSAQRPQFDAGDPAAYPAAGWAPYDAVVRAAQSLGVGLDFTVGPPAPLWAEAPGEPAGGPVGDWRPSADQFGQFVRAVGERYSGRYPDPLHPGRALPRVSFWAIWNEPNFGIELAPQAIDHTRVAVAPRLYRSLLDAAWSALQASGHGGDTILFGELSPKGQTIGGPGNFDGMVPLRFLRALYCVDSHFHVLRGAMAAARGCPGTAAGFAAAHPALFDATGLSDHPYPQALPPNVPTPDEPDFADLPALGKLGATLDRLQQIYGSSRRLPIYSTEYGYLTTPPETLFHAVSPATAAEYLNWAEYLSWRNPRVRSYDQYLLTDPPAGNFPSGLEFSGGRPKPTMSAFRLPIFLPVTTAASAPAALEVWGCARPARYARIDTGRPQQVEIQFQPAVQGLYRTIRTVTLSDPDGYFDVRQRFPGSGTVRLAWTYPDGTQVFSREVQLTLG